MKHYFLDTNIVIDVLANRLPFAESASSLFNLAEKGKIKLKISALSYANVYYIVRKAVPHKQLIALLQDLESLVETLAVTKDIISQSLSGDFSDFEDAIQYNTAVSDKKIIAIVTRNVKDYKGSKVTVLTPDEVLSTLANG